MCKRVCFVVLLVILEAYLLLVLSYSPLLVNLRPETSFREDNGDNDDDNKEEE